MQVVHGCERYGVRMNKTQVVHEVSLPLKVRVRGQVACDLQDAETAFGELRRKAIALRDAFGSQTYVNANGEEVFLGMDLWVKATQAQETTRLRWRWHWTPNGNKKRSGKKRDVGVINSLADVMNDPNSSQYRFVWEFFADICETPLLRMVQQFEIARLEVNARLLQAGYHVKGLGQLLTGLGHMERLTVQDDDMYRQLAQFAAQRRKQLRLDEVDHE